MAVNVFEQDFKTIRDKLLIANALFEDDKFPANDSSIFFKKNPIKQPFQWKRPDLSKNPQLFEDGVSRFDVLQGRLGDCWMLAALVNLTLHPPYFDQVVPRDQSFQTEHYAGIFHFRFWQYGQWVEVVIDDRLPTYEDGSLFVRSSKTNEYWSALVEKAYAKLHGSYEALNGGYCNEGMEDFTGGISEMISLAKDPPTSEHIYKAYEFSSLMACSIKGNQNEVELVTQDGLVKNHGFSITKFQYVDMKSSTNTESGSERILLVRIRNPWGNNVEWNGAWSDGSSSRWDLISEDQKKEINFQIKDDGEFWMSFADFTAKFTDLEICYVSFESFLENSFTDNTNCYWKQLVLEGSWNKGSTAGGCTTYQETFHNNPQYIIHLDDPDDDGGQCTMIVALMQKNRRAQRRPGQTFYYSIGITLYKLSTEISHLQVPLTKDYLNYILPENKPFFNEMREVVFRFHLPPGKYCIVPSTLKPNQEAEFILRVVTTKKRTMEHHDDEPGMGSVDAEITQFLSLPGDENAAFNKTAGDKQEVNWFELQMVLDSSLNPEMKSRWSALACGIAGKTKSKYRTTVSKDACRSMIAIMDVNKSGTLGFEEFKSLWAEINKWKIVFNLYSGDVSKGLSAFTLRQALKAGGYRLNNRIHTMLVQRYSTKDGTIMFDDFLMCAIEMKGMIDRPETYRALSS